DAAFLAIGITAQGVFAAEPGRLRVALIGIEHGLFRPHHVLHAQHEAPDEIHQEEAFEDLSDAAHDCLGPLHFQSRGEVPSLPRLASPSLLQRAWLACMAMTCWTLAASALTP